MSLQGKRAEQFWVTHIKTVLQQCFSTVGIYFIAMCAELHGKLLGDTY
jgi:hypothetical protein